MYTKAAMALKSRKSKVESEGKIYPNSEAENDAKTIESFTHLT